MLVVCMLYTVKSVLNYFNKQGSTVTMAALDISKAFDKVNHYVLFSKLLDRRVPLCMIKVLVCWYGKCNAVVRWQSSMSHVFVINAGVRQGGVLSPLLFSVYMDNLIDKLEACGYGCKVHGVYAGCILYADDIILLAHTSYAMQKMLDVCSEESISLDLKFNVNKSVALRVGPRWRTLCAPLTLGSTALRFVQSTKYLGVYLKSDVKYSCSYGHLKLRFYSCFNALFSRSKASNSELVTTEVLNTVCIPMLTYALEVTDPNKTATSMLNNLINRAICKIFNCCDSDTVNDVKHFLDVYDIRTVYQERRTAFLHKTSLLDNNVLRTVLVCC